MLPIARSRSLTASFCSSASAPGPRTSYFENELMSISATRSRTARCSSLIASKAGPRSKDGVSITRAPAGAARRRDARGEAAAQIEIVDLRREADDRLAVGGDRNGAADHLPDADLAERRDARGGRFGQRRETLEIRLQQLGTEVGANAI